MRMLHAAVFTNSQAFAGGLQFFFAHFRFFAGLKAFGSAFVRGGHRAVACDVFFAFFVGVGRCCKGRAGHQDDQCGKEHVFFHDDIL